MDKTTDPKDYTASSLAAAAGVDKSYIARLCRRGVITAEKLTATVWLIRYEVGQAWLEERQAKQAQP